MFRFSADLYSYMLLFEKSALRVKKQGDLILSSCSSQISYEEFYTIVENALSGAKRKARVIRFSGQGSDHTYPHVCTELRYLKFIHLVLD